MDKEFILIGDYVSLGDLRAYCVKSNRRLLWCKFCTFENTERCTTLECRSWARPDGENVIFTIKLNHK